MRLIRVIFLLTAWALGIAAVLSEPPAYFALPEVLLFSTPTIVLESQRIFITLDNPVLVLPSKIAITASDLVVGYQDQGIAAAWPYDALAPRHIINDGLGDLPVMVDC